jgi:hypothetical protein
VSDSSSYLPAKKRLSDIQRDGLRKFVTTIHELLAMCAHGGVSIEADVFIENHLTSGRINAIAKLFQEPEDDMPDARLGYILFPGSVVWDCNAFVRELVRPWIRYHIGEASPSDVAFLTAQEEQDRKYAFQKLREYVAVLERELQPAEKDVSGTIAVWRHAADVLEKLAWIDGEPCPFGEDLEFSPEAADAWSVCHRAVWKLPRDGKPFSVERHLQNAFPAAWELPRPAGQISGDIIERWDPPKPGPWVSRSDIARLRVRGALIEQSNRAESVTIVQPKDTVVPQAPVGSDHKTTKPKRLILENWAFGYDAEKNQWWLFLKAGNFWQQKRKVSIPRGAQNWLLKCLAAGNGAIDRSALLAKKRESEPLVESRRSRKSLTEAISRLRITLSTALARTARCEVSQVRAVLPLQGKAYRSKVEVGYAIPVAAKPDVLRFQLDHQFRNEG